MISGIFVNVLKVYRPQLIIGWVVLIIGSGLLSIVTADSARGLSLGLQFVNGVGIGFVYLTVYFPILAPLPITSTAQALALYNYLRAIAQVCFSILFIHHLLLIFWLDLGCHNRKCGSAKSTQT